MKIFLALNARKALEQREICDATRNKKSEEDDNTARNLDEPQNSIGLNIVNMDLNSVDLSDLLVMPLDPLPLDPLTQAIVLPIDFSV